MRGQQHTLMSYVVWAVFFTLLLLIAQQISNTFVRSYVPFSFDSIISAIKDAEELYIAGEDDFVCTYISTPAFIEIDSEFLKRYVKDVSFSFECRHGGCEAGSDYIRINGNGTLCFKREDDIMKVVWKR